ncbi:TPA: hypothetical protein HA344_07935 [Candidatus Bathyarchaeota archaeon]|nr:hypothetical protein [Candidatus Bathyarchaeota archaeon]
MLENIPPSLLFALIILLIATSFIVFFRLPSGVYRQRLREILKPLGIVGLVLGLALPWDQGLGLVVAIFLAVVLFVLCVYAVVVLEAPPSLVKSVWIRRDVVRDWLIYISIIAGIIGIVSTLLSIILQFWNITLGIEIPLAFDTISVSAALLESMIPITSYRKIYSLIYLHLMDEDADSGTLSLTIKEADFPMILKDTSFTEFEVRDSLESLFAQGAAKKVVSKEGLIFEISDDCRALLRVSLEETRAKIRIGVERYEEKLDELLEHIEHATVKDHFKIVKRIDAFEKELIVFIEENSRFEEILLLKMRLNTLLELKKTMYSEEID